MKQIVWHFERLLDLTDFTLMRPLVAMMIFVSGGVPLWEVRIVDNYRLFVRLIRQRMLLLTDLVVVFTNYIILDRETGHELTVRT